MAIFFFIRYVAIAVREFLLTLFITFMIAFANGLNEAATSSPKFVLFLIAVIIFKFLLWASSCASLGQRLQTSSKNDPLQLYSKKETIFILCLYSVFFISDAALATVSFLIFDETVCFYLFIGLLTLFLVAGILLTAIVAIPKYEKVMKKMEENEKNAEKNDLFEEQAPSFVNVYQRREDADNKKKDKDDVGDIFDEFKK